MTASPPDSEFRSTFTSALTSGLLPGAWLLLGLLAVVFLPLISGGWHLAGDAGDTLLNNIFLEHFYRWITGHEPSYWSPRYFYPYPWTLAWSENHLGTAWIYAMGRLFGLSREAAHFGWYLVGFIANYLAAYWVGRRLRLGSLAVAAGAFFFAFGLPLTNQEGHNQLIYRWCVPLAFYAIYSFAKHQKLRDFVSALVFLAIQIYTNLYIGAFLSLLLVLETLLLPFFVELASSQTGWRQKLLWLPSALISSWHLAPPRRRLFLSLIAAASVLAVAALAYPYIETARLYKFTRRWDEISAMLPRAQSYLYAPHSKLWSSSAPLFRDLPISNEHGIFPGLWVLSLLAIGLLLRFERRAEAVARLHLATFLAIVILTLSVYGASFYWVIAILPGFGSIRAVSRIQLVNMWPLALYSMVVIDGLSRYRHRWINLRAVVALLSVFLVIESASIRHQRVSFKDFRSRRHEIREAVKGKKLPEKPILFVAERPKEAFWLRELAAMAVAQDLGWPTFNGYSGYAPLGHVRATSCSALPGRLLAYLRWAQMVDLARYREMMKRVVLVGFHDCHQGWWKAMPSFTFGSRDLTRDEFRKIRLSVQALKREGKHKARLRVDVINGSGRLLHTHSRKGHHLRLSWRWIDVATNKSLGGFEQRVPLESDLKSGKTQPLDFLIEVPKGKKGKFLLEVSLVQEAVFWLHDLGVTLPRAELEE